MLFLIKFSCGLSSRFVLPMSFELSSILLFWFLLLDIFSVISWYIPINYHKKVKNWSKEPNLIITNYFIQSLVLVTTLFILLARPRYEFSVLVNGCCLKIVFFSVARLRDKSPIPRYLKVNWRQKIMEIARRFFGNFPRFPKLAIFGDFSAIYDQ